MRKAIGPELIEFGYITAEFAGGRQVSRLRLPRDHPVANNTAPSAAEFGVPRELCTMTPYDVPQQWATALAGVADGIRYETRFSPDPEAIAVAIFGEMGDAGWPGAPHRESVSLTVAARRCGIEVRRPPSAVTIVEPLA